LNILNTKSKFCSFEPGTAVKLPDHFVNLYREPQLDQYVKVLSPGSVVIWLSQIKHDTWAQVLTANGLFYVWFGEFSFFKV
jgi:hypothetical protein